MDPAAAIRSPCGADTCTQLRRRLDRERKSRLDAEATAERGLRDLYMREQQLRLLARIASAANQTQSVREVMQFALTQICETVNWPVGHVYLTEQGPDAVRLRSMRVWHVTAPERTAEFQAATETLVFGPNMGLPGRVYARRTPQWIFDMTQAVGFQRRAVATACGLKAACGFPVLVGEEVAAVLEFFTDRSLEQDDALLELMSQIGVQLGRVMERKRAEERLIHDASHDPLTGLPNRALFLDRVNQALERRLRGGQEFAVLFVDLDRFKVVNDSLGHFAGDTLIVGVAARLGASLRKDALAAGSAPCREGTLARLGGDEFTILLPDIPDPGDAVRVANLVQEALRHPFTIEGQDVYTSASIGIASSTTGYDSATAILRDADLAMYRAKARGKARSEPYDRDMHAAAVRRLKLEADLRRALSNNEFVLHYQPIISLRTREVTGFEALVRWRTPDGKLVYPGEFIGMAEDTGLILFIGLWVLREACGTIRRLQEEFPHEKPLTISINISPRQFMQPDLVSQVRRIIGENGVDPSTVRLEITESVTSGDAEQSVSILSQLKEIGLHLSIDDFGTGYSSLSYLHRFPIDVIKIDRSFVSAMDKSDESLQIVRTIMSLAQNLGKCVVAEGAETEAQVTQLQSLGCDFGQGYFFSRPLDLAAVRSFLRKPLHWKVSESPSNPGLAGADLCPV